MFELAGGRVLVEWKPVNLFGVCKGKKSRNSWHRAEEYGVRNVLIGIA